MIIRKVSHVPIQEPMVVQGRLSQAWVLFFEQLARGVDVSEFADLLSLSQISQQLPNQAIQGQVLHHVDKLVSVMPQVPIYQNQTQTLPMVAIPTMGVL